MAMGAPEQQEESDDRERREGEAEGEEKQAAAPGIVSQSPLRLPVLGEDSLCVEVGRPGGKPRRRGIGAGILGEGRRGRRIWRRPPFKAGDLPVQPL